MDQLSGLIGNVGNGLSTAAGDVGSAFGGATDFLGNLFSGGGSSAIPVPTTPDLGAVPTTPTIPTPTSGGAISAGPSAAAVADPLGAAASGGISAGSDVLSQALGAGATGVTPNLPAQAPITADSTTIPGLNTTPLPGGVSATAPTASASPPANGGFFQNPNVKNALGAGVLGLDLFKGLQTPPGVSALKTLAGQEGNLAKVGQAQEWAGNNGILPAGAEAKVQANLNASIAAIKSNYAKMGMSGSSAETADINAAKQAAEAETFQIGQGYAQQGLSELQTAMGAQDTLLSQILNAETAQDTALGQSLAAFAGATAK